MVHDNYKEDRNYDFSRDWSLSTVPDNHTADNGPGPYRRRLSSKNLEIPESFDELWLGGWLHIEQMTDNYYWMRVGDNIIEAHNTPDGGYTKLYIGDGDIVIESNSDRTYDIKFIPEDTLTRWKRGEQERNS